MLFFLSSGANGNVTLSTDDYSVGEHNLTVVATDQSGNNATDVIPFFTPEIGMQLKCSDKKSTLLNFSPLSCVSQFLFSSTVLQLKRTWFLCSVARQQGEMA